MQENIPGLDFINELKPVSYNYKAFEFDKFLLQNNPAKLASLKQTDYTEAESLVHMGFIAQDVAKLVKDKGYHLSLVHTPTNTTDNYSIAYGELIMPLVKAVQELAFQNASLKVLIQKQQQQIDLLITLKKQ